MKSVIVAREQDNGFKDYPEYEREIKTGETVTVGMLRKEFNQKLNIDAEMIFLVDGTPATEERILLGDEKLLAKYPAKSRGL